MKYETKKEITVHDMLKIKTDIMKYIKKPEDVSKNIELIGKSLSYFIPKFQMPSNRTIILAGSSEPKSKVDNAVTSHNHNFLIYIGAARAQALFNMFLLDEKAIEETKFEDVEVIFYEDDEKGDILLEYKEKDKKPSKKKGKTIKEIKKYDVLKFTEQEKDFIRYVKDGIVKVYKEKAETKYDFNGLKSILLYLKEETHDGFFIDKAGMLLELSNKAGNVASEVKVLKKEIESLIKKKESLEKKVKKLEEKKERIRNKKKQTEKDWKKLEEIEQDIEKIKKEIEEKNSRINEIKNKLPAMREFLREKTAEYNLKVNNKQNQGYQMGKANRVLNILFRKNEADIDFFINEKNGSALFFNNRIVPKLKNSKFYEKFKKDYEKYIACSPDKKYSIQKDVLRNAEHALFNTFIRNLKKTLKEEEVFFDEITFKKFVEPMFDMFLDFIGEKNINERILKNSDVKNMENTFKKELKCFIK